MGTQAIIQINQIAGKGTLFSGGEFTQIIPFEMYIYKGHRHSVRVYGRGRKKEYNIFAIGQIIAAACSWAR